MTAKAEQAIFSPSRNQGTETQSGASGFRVLAIFSGRDVYVPTDNPNYVRRVTPGFKPPTLTPSSATKQGA